jgi:hypothetical protein
VTVIEALDRILSCEDPYASAVISEALRADGVVVRTGQFVQRIDPLDRKDSARLRPRRRRRDRRGSGAAYGAYDGPAQVRHGQLDGPARVVSTTTSAAPPTSRRSMAFRCQRATRCGRPHAPAGRVTEAVRPDEIGAPVDIGAPGALADACHADHVHFGFDG